MVRDIDFEIEEISDLVKKEEKGDEIAKRRYNSIENDLRAVAGMYAKVKIRHFDGKKH